MEPIQAQGGSRGLLAASTADQRDVAIVISRVARPAGPTTSGCLQVEHRA